MRDQTNAILLTMLCITGCVGLSKTQETRYVEPLLPMTLTAEELVEHLNQQSGELHSWRCTDMSTTAHMPKTPPARLSGMIACEAPNHFRLKASNMIAQADLGANDERCWFYVTPGGAGVLTWKHEDTPLLQQCQIGVPRVDPAWLMEVLCVRPLNAEGMTTSRGHADEKELWLTSIEDNFDGKTIRRVIKVDTVSGRIREHAIHDPDGDPLIRALITEHRTFKDHLLPTRIRLEFPAMETALVMSFGRIEPNCGCSESLWQLPSDKSGGVTDLGDVVRTQLQKADNRGETPARSISRSGNLSRPDTLTQDAVSSVAHGNRFQEAANDSLDEEFDASGDNADAEVVPEWDTPSRPQRRWSLFRNPFRRR